MNRSLIGLFSLILLGPAFSTACGDGESNSPPQGDGDGDGTGGKASGGSGTGGAGSGGELGSGGAGTGGLGMGGYIGQCSDLQTKCEGVCTNLDSDPKNCGECGSACAPTEGCNSGECADFECLGQQVVCDEECVSLQSNNKHCGACDIACAPGQTCDNGACSATCPGAQVACDGMCVNTLRDPDHCGGCNLPCAAGQACTEGTCQVECPTGQIACNGTCIDPESDDEYCGATDCSEAAGLGGASGDGMGVACTMGEACVDGMCELDCAPQQTACSDSCVNTDRDAQNCGDCQHACRSGESCSLGECVTACPDGQLACNGSCIHPATDLEYCGATDCSDDSTDGQACTANERCAAGSCELECGSLLACDGSCIDPDTNPTFCGATDCTDDATNGSECLVTESCVLGECHPLLKEWQPGARIDTGAGTVYTEQDIASDSRNNAAVIWRQATNPADNNDFASNRLFAAVYDPATETWGSPTQVSTAEVSVRNGEVIMVEGGTAVATWVEGGTSGINRLLSAFYNPAAGVWSEPVPIHALGTGAVDTPEMAFEPDGRVSILWAEGPNPGSALNIYLRRFDPVSMTFDNAVALPKALGATDLAMSPRIAVNADGHAAAVWMEAPPATSRRLFASHADLTQETPTWSTPVAMGTRFVKLEAQDLAIRDDGLILVPYINFEGTTAQDLFVAECNVTASACDQSSDWTNTLVIGRTDTGAQPNFARITLLPDNKAVLVARTEQVGTTPNGPLFQPPFSIVGLVYDGSAWGSSKDLSGPFSDSPNPFPSIESDRDGNTFVSWVQGSEAKATRYVATLSAWTQPVVLNDETLIGNAGAPALAGTSNGDAFASWVQSLSGVSGNHLQVATFH